MQNASVDSLNCATLPDHRSAERRPLAESVERPREATVGMMAETKRDHVKNVTIDNCVVGVLCVDDNPLVGEALGITLRQERGMKWLGQRLTADNLRMAIDDLAPQVILLDLDMPGRNPFDALREVSDEFPDIRVIVLTGHVRREYVDRAFECGAWGYLSKTEGASRIISAIRRVLADEIVMSPEVEVALGQ